MKTLKLNSIRKWFPIIASSKFSAANWFVTLNQDIRGNAARHESFSKPTRLVLTESQLTSPMTFVSSVVLMPTARLQFRNLTSDSRIVFPSGEIRTRQTRAFTKSIHFKGSLLGSDSKRV